MDATRSSRISPAVRDGLVLAGIVFLFALSIRAVVAWLFLTAHGWHAVSGIEFWFYYGLAEGVFQLPSVWDPTEWILSPLGLLFDGDALVLAVRMAAGVCDAVNAALIALLAARLHGRRTGFLAGMLYAGSVPTVFSSAATLTHDVFGVPWLVLTLLAAVVMIEGRLFGDAAVRLGTGRRLAAAVLAAFSLFIATRIGPVALLTTGAVTVYIAWQAVVHRLGRRRADDPVIFGLFLAALLALALLLHLKLMPRLMAWLLDTAQSARGLDVRAQIAAGAGDMMGTSMGDYWLRFNFHVFFLPAGLIVAFKRKDAMTWGLLVCGALAALAADRGTRLLMPAMALCTALAFSDWKNARLTVLVPWAMLVVLLTRDAQLPRTLFVSTSVFFLLTAVELTIVLIWSQRPHWHVLRAPGVAVVAWLFAVMIAKTNLSLDTSEQEYNAYRQLRDLAQGHGKILVTCFEGYFAEAVSGLPSAVNPERIDPGLERMFCMPERKAAAVLRNKGIRYVAFSRKHYGGFKLRDATHVNVAVAPRAARPDPRAPMRLSEWHKTLLYGMFHAPDRLAHFRSVTPTNALGQAQMVVVEVLAPDPE